MTKKIVIRVQIHNEKCRKKAMVLVASAQGVDSVAVHGEERDHLVAIGDGIDSVNLVSALRKKVAPADIVGLSEVEYGDGNGDSDGDGAEMETPAAAEPEVDEVTQWRPSYYYAPQHPAVVYERPYEPSYREDSCSIM